MGDRFVDVSYRGLDVGRQLKLRDVTTEGGYLESTTPMPVGTPLEIALDDGTRLAAVVVLVHEHIAGGTDVAGMRVRPVVIGAAARRWWDSQPEPPPRPAPMVATPPPASPAIIDVQPVAAAAPPEPVPANGASVGSTGEAAPSAVAAVLASEAIEVETSDASSDEISALDEDPSESSASRPIATPTNGHGDPSSRTKRKPKRRKRNTR